MSRDRHTYLPLSHCPGGERRIQSNRVTGSFLARDATKERPRGPGGVSIAVVEEAVEWRCCMPG